MKGPFLFFFLCVLFFSKLALAIWDPCNSIRVLPGVHHFSSKRWLADLGRGCSTVDCFRELPVLTQTVDEHGLSLCSVVLDFLQQ